MRRFVVCAMFLAALQAVPALGPVPRVMARGAQMGDATGRITDVDRRQWRLRLDTGEEMYATDIRYLDGLKEGDRVHVRYIDTGGRRSIIRIDHQ
jgi:hypothetical protein